MAFAQFCLRRLERSLLGAVIEFHQKIANIDLLYGFKADPLDDPGRLGGHINSLYRHQGPDGGYRTTPGLRFGGLGNNTGGRLGCTQHCLLYDFGYHHVFELRKSSQHPGQQDEHKSRKDWVFHNDPISIA